MKPHDNRNSIENYLPDGQLSLPGYHSIVSVITNYKILKSISLNCPLESLLIPASQLMTVPQFTAGWTTPLINIIGMMIQSGFNAIPILDDCNRVVNVYASPDILQYVTDTLDFDLTIPVESAIINRSPNFEGVHTCKESDTLGYVISGFKKSTVHRILVVDELKKLLGIIRLVDIMKYLVLE